MMTHPEINPIAINLGLIQIHWYGLMYFFAFILFYYLGKYRIKTNPWYRLNVKILDDLFSYGALGVIIGGRLGYALFYQPIHYFTHPLEIFAIWNGGMSFHGGLVGVLSSVWLVARKYHKEWFCLTDFIAPLVAIGLGFGRIGNFINQELWGKPTKAPWGVIFPKVDLLTRHPSQLYEFFLEGVLLFLVLWIYSGTQRARKKISGLFLIGYSLSRIIVECFREPDHHLGYLFGSLTMGQLLSLPMLLFGIYLFLSNND
jgi:phosphatidylglycerol:prolipoprotein diacylglycerol transferase